ncbi:MAG: cold shock domain-containing protein [Candidatus Omnitrophica bacterium]|nr:cold shock domain-containing protein [Candidatus Omnitrophota bacterium]
MVKGKVKWFNNQKGYGFIVADGDHGKDVFVHYSEVQGEGYKTLTAGDDVELDVVDGEKGRLAKNVIKANGG